MSRTARCTALGLASFGLLGGSLIASTPAYAAQYKEVDGADCLKDDHDSKCRSKTWLDADEKKIHGNSGWKLVTLTADADFFQKEEDDHYLNDGYGKGDDDLGEVEFQYWDEDEEAWNTFFTEDVDEDGEADVKVKIKAKNYHEVTLRAEYSGVEDEIKGSTSNEVEID